MYVVDASVWVSRIVQSDAHHKPSRDWLGSVLGSGLRVFAPVLLLAEVAGAVSRRTGRAEEGLRAVGDITSLRDVRLVRLGPEMALSAARTAAELGIRGADATYVSLSVEAGFPLVTWDSEQHARGSAVVVTRTPGELMQEHGE